MVDDKFGGGDCRKNEARILSTSFAFNNLAKVSFLTFDTKKTFNFL